MNPARFLLGALLLLSLPTHAASPWAKENAVPLRAEAFPLDQVRLLDGPFKHAMELDAKYLLSLNSDRLLSWFRKEAGLPPKGQVYGGWESRGVAGHSLGHYLTACALMYQATGDARFKERLAYLIDELRACQEANGNGYLAAIPRGKEIFAEVAQGDIRSQGFDLNGGWVPWYTEHKVFAGLRDAYVLAGIPKALTVYQGMGDWVLDVTRTLNEEQWQRMLACEHGGMNEIMADLYALTGEAKYLEVARKFRHRAILDPLAARRDELAGKHANTQIPKLIGAARIYELTGDEAFGTMSRFFWETVTHNHSYVTGGNSLGEHFGQPGRLNDRLGNNTTETCNTYNMLKLTAQLFCREPQAGLADYYERAVFNHILASQNPDDGMVCYFVPLKSGSQKEFMTPFESFTCCTGTGMENHAKYGEAIYFHSADTLFVNLYLASELDWRAKGLRLRQETAFPASGKVSFTVKAGSPAPLTLKLRQPAWCQQPPTVRLNGKRLKLSATEGYLAINRTWQDGDRVELELPLTLRTEAMPDNPKRVAVFYGPVLLAGDLGPAGKDAPVPVLLTENQPVAKWVKPVKGQPLTFRTKSVGRPADVTLTPFYAFHGRRHAVYWDVFTQSEWQAREAALRVEEARLKALAARTTDLLAIGEMQPERDHHVQGENTAAGDALGRKFRHATEGGWFAFDLAVSPDQPVDLVLTYWGSDSNNRVFDILADGTKLATQTLDRNQPGKFFDVTYPLPSELTQGKRKVTIRIQAQPGKWAGGVFGVRMLKRQ